MIPFLILIPILAAILIIAPLDYTRAGYAKYIALMGSLLSLGLLYYVTYGSYSFHWLSVGSISLNITSMITPVNMLLLAVVLVVAPIILIYSFGYISLPSEQRRFYIEMLIFEAAMVVFSISGDFITLFIAWEFLSFMSYLLIGFWYKHHRASRAARKAITIVLIGDIALLAAMVLLWNAFGSFSFASIFAVAGSHLDSVYAASILLVIAVLTKSAQFPFQEWLPDAMEGPTPVSAFLHSSTMVKAGVFLVIILYPFFYSTNVMGILIVSGIITVVLSTMNAMKETQIKRVAAYSTVQELGLMIVAASSGALLACLYFFLVQSFYKALLFFSAGSVTTATGKDDLNEVYGLRANKLVYITTLVSVLSIAGFIPFSGFFSNIGMDSSLSSNLYVYAIISVIGLSTSFFVFRWFLLASKKPKSEAAEAPYSSLPRSMMLAMVLMAALTLLSSLAFFYLPTFLNGQSYYLGNFIGRGGISLGSYYDPIIETLLALAGAVISYMIYRSRRSLGSSFLSSVMHNGTAVNAVYEYFAKLVYGFSEGVAIFDIYLSEFFDDIGRLTALSGRALRRLSVGSINLYVLVFSLALIAVFSYAYFFGVI